MTRLKLEVIFHCSDDYKEHQLLADRLAQHMREFRNPEISRNNKLPHYEDLTISVEHKEWSARD